MVGYNPLPDPQTWALTTRDGADAASADGKVGLLRVEYRPWSREIDDRPCAETRPDRATTWPGISLLSGLAEAPRVTVNGRPVEARRIGQDFQIALGSP